ncbi:DUF3857 domain-containing protein [Herbaspirillum sp. 1130]|uniref:DUF3857 domain-containing protein n=1 Tax=Herbaspirillum sp. 1130 TaxID=2806562 RepID=UPI001AE257EF|nr:DUF3857 domain-containing protein [Herbaspirillum sp. 1130]MBP1314854.1 lipoprotein NlpI/transglutaminase-like putative cysteine protease [Herbaspirillum sp. 1130]
MRFVSPRGLLATLLCSLSFVVHAQLPAAPGAAATESTEAPSLPVREIQVASEAFTRGDKIPSWVEPIEVPATRRTEAIVMRLWDTQFRADSQPVFYVNRAAQINDSSALASAGQLIIDFVPQYQKMHLHSLRVLRGKEVLDHTSRVQVRFLQRELGMENGVFSGSVQAVMLVPDLRVGDTVQYAYSVEGTNPVFGSTYANEAGWDWPIPVELRSVILSHPVGQRVDWKMVGEIGNTDIRPDISQAAGWRKLRFTERGIRIEEPDRWVPADFSLRRLQFTSWDSWNSVARWADGLFPPAPVPAALQARLEQWKKLPTDEQRAVAALRWVQDEIRYFSVSMGESSHRPHPPADVVRDRYGDCKDKTYLLVTLLRAMGMNAVPILTSLAEPRTVARYLPSPLVFDHVLVRLRLDGADYYLDPTMQGQSGSLSKQGSGVEGAAILAVAPETTALESMHWTDAVARNTAILDEVIEIPALDADGTLSATWTWVGSDAETMRVVSRSLPEERLRKFALGGYERRYPGIDLMAVPVLEDDAANNRVIARARFKLPKPAKAYPDGWVVKYGASIMQGIYDLPRNFKRSYPAKVSRAPYRLRYTLRMVWPSNVSMMRDPLERNLRNEFFTYSTKRVFRGNVLQVERSLEVLKDTVTPDELLALNSALQQLDSITAQGEFVEREAIKTSGFLGMGSSTLKDTVRRRLQEELAAYDRVIAAGRLRGNDLVEALCRRAEVRAEMDEPAKGMTDAEEAVRQGPSNPRAWECRGHVARDSRDFARSIPDYTRALTLGGNEGSLYQSRGISRFFMGKYQEALADFTQSVLISKDDAESRHYVLLWQGLAARRTGQPPSAELLQAARGKGSDDVWPNPLLALVAGSLGEDGVLQAAQRKQGDDKDMALTEAWFFIGQMRLASGNVPAAREAFENARKPGVSVYLEYQAAGWELARLEQAASK